MSNCPKEILDFFQLPTSRQDTADFYKRIGRVTSNPLEARKFVQQNYPAWPLCGAPCFKKCVDETIPKRFGDAIGIGKECALQCSRACSDPKHFSCAPTKENQKTKPMTVTFTANPNQGIDMLYYSNADGQVDFEYTDINPTLLQKGFVYNSKGTGGSFKTMHTLSNEPWVPETNVTSIQAEPLRGVGRYSVKTFRQEDKGEAKARIEKFTQKKK